MKDQNITIRPETTADHESIGQVNQEAFGSDGRKTLDRGNGAFVTDFHSLPMQ